MFQDRVRNRCLPVTQSSWLVRRRVSSPEQDFHTGVRATGDRIGSSRLAADISDAVRETRRGPNPRPYFVDEGGEVRRCENALDPTCRRGRLLAFGRKTRPDCAGHMTCSLHWASIPSSKSWSARSSRDLNRPRHPLPGTPIATLPTPPPDME